MRAWGALLLLVVCGCASAADQSVYLGNMGPWTYDDTSVYSDAVTLEGLRITGQARIEETPSENFHVVRWTDLSSSITANALVAVSVTDIDDPSTELNALAGSALGNVRICYQDAEPSLFTIYAYDPGTGQTENVPYTVDGSSGIWVAVAGAYQNDMTIEGLTVNGVKGATNDFIVHGDTVDDVLFVDVSTNTVYTSGTLRANASAVFNAAANSTADVTISNSSGASILYADVSADMLNIGGGATFNYLKGATQDFTIHGDTVDNIFKADVSSDTLNMAATAIDITGNSITFGSAASGTTQEFAFDTFGSEDILLKANGNAGSFTITNNSGDTMLSMRHVGDVAFTDLAWTFNYEGANNNDFSINTDNISPAFFVDTSADTLYTSAPLVANALVTATANIKVGDGTDTSASITFDNSTNDFVIYTSPALNEMLIDGFIGGYSTSGGFIVDNYTPTNASDTGHAGQFAMDGTYIYFCTATNTWIRFAHGGATW